MAAPPISRRALLRGGLPSLALAMGETGCAAPELRREVALGLFQADTRHASIALASYVLRSVTYVPTGKDGHTVLINAPVPSAARTGAQRYMTRLRHHAETRLLQHWRVIPSERFVATLDYQELQGPPPPHIAPTIADYPMRMFGTAEDRTHGHPLKRFSYSGRLEADTASALAALAGTDLIAIIEFWTQGWLYFGVYDRSGALVFGDASIPIYTNFEDPYPLSRVMSTRGWWLHWVEMAEARLEAQLSIEVEA